jgi:hypothetical protein
VPPVGIGEGIVGGLRRAERVLHPRVVVEERQEHADAFHDGGPQLRLDAHPVVLEPPLHGGKLLGLRPRLGRGHALGAVRARQLAEGLLALGAPRGPGLRLGPVLPRPRREGLRRGDGLFGDDEARLACREALLAVRDPGAELVRVDDVLVDLEERHVVIEHLMQQDHELDQVRAGLLPERLLPAAKQIGHQRGNAVGQRVGIEGVVERVVAIDGVETDLDVVALRWCRARIAWTCAQKSPFTSSTRAPSLRAGSSPGSRGAARGRDTCTPWSCRCRWRRRYRSRCRARAPGW